MTSNRYRKGILQNEQLRILLAVWMRICGVWARIASYVSPKSREFSQKCCKRRAVSLVFEIYNFPELILQGSCKGTMFLRAKMWR